MFPVYAGVILDVSGILRISLSVPRVCGGDPKSVNVMFDLNLVFPVYAGVILDKGEECFKSYCVPRVCGGDPLSWRPFRCYNKCSPCMRG